MRVVRGALNSVAYLTYFQLDCLKPQFHRRDMKNSIRIVRCMQTRQGKERNNYVGFISFAQQTFAG